jgi:type IV pilus assembly protein PilB
MSLSEIQETFNQLHPQRDSEIKNNYSVSTEDFDLVNFPFDRTTIALVPASICRRHMILPLRVTDGHMVLAMVDPNNVIAIDDVWGVTHLRVEPVKVLRSDLLAAIDRFLRSDDELNVLTTSIAETSHPLEINDYEEMGSLEGEAPIVRLVNLLINQAIQDRASDIHIEPSEHGVRVRYRIDGVLHDMPSTPKSIQNGLLSRLKIMSDIDIAEHRKPQDGRMSVQYEGRKIDLRVATLPTVWGEKIVLRILDNAKTKIDIRDLGMLDRNFKIYEESYEKPYGLILVTGPTGSGKSTTLYTTLGAVSTPEINVITVEDPIEFRMSSINQVQVNPKAGLTFASALRSILRSDPDVVLIGEIRDHETALIAIEASLTGHLVFSTLHTNDAPSAITRLIEMGIEPFLVGSALECVVAQRLSRRLCVHCKAPVEHSRDFLASLNFTFSVDSKPPTIYKAVGCANCSKTGYQGRLAIHEVMTVTEEIQRLAVGRASSIEIAKMAAEQGMLNLHQDGWAKVQLGLTSIEEILRVVS